MEYEILNALVKVAPLLTQMNSTEIGIGITDREKFLTYLPAKDLNFGLKAGDPINDPSIQNVLSTGKTFQDVVPTEVYGVPFRARVLPIFEKNQLVGCFCLATNIRTEYRIKDITNQLLDSMSQITASSEEISATAETAATRTENMTNEAKKVKEIIKNTNEILHAVKYVADRTRLLGLNAAIEAARAGEVGRGFAVVADEVRKLADKSQESLTQAYQFLQELQNSTVHLFDFMDEINSLAENQAAASEEVAASTEEITAVFDELANLVKDL